jgi:CMP-N-acetylneuraminic acid synthetase
MKSISVVTNARLGSTRVPKKLVLPFAESSLIDIALSKLDKMDFFEHRYLAVADKELVEIGRKYENIEILERDVAAVKKGVNPLTVTFEHYLRVPSDYIFVFNPCLPCIRIETIKKAFDCFQATDFNSYTAVIPTGDWIFDSEGNALTNSDPRNATTNKDRSFLKGCHAFHIIKKEFFREQKILWTFKPNDPHLVRIPEDEAVDVDTPAEFDLAENIYRQSRTQIGKHGF